MQGLEAVAQRWKETKKETVAWVFSCEFREIFKNTIFYRVPLVAVSEGFSRFQNFLSFMGKCVTKK